MQVLRQQFVRVAGEVFFVEMGISVDTPEDGEKVVYTGHHHGRIVGLYDACQAFAHLPKMLDDVIVGLGYDASEDDDVTPKEPSVQSKLKASILEKLEKGAISVEEALKQIKKGE